jgi:hypothetical protein
LHTKQSCPTKSKILEKIIIELVCEQLRILIDVKGLSLQKAFIFLVLFFYGENNFPATVNGVNLKSMISK